MDPANLFPSLYHAQHQNFVEDLPFWLGLAAAQGSPILELGCGSGRVLLPLSQAGYHLVGIDNDAGMLALLKTRLPPALQPGISLLLADIAHIPLAGWFGLIVMPCNTLSTLTRQAQAEALRGVSALLGPGGLFAVSLPNPEVLRRMPRHSEPEIEDTFLHPLTGEPVQVSSAWEKVSGQLVVTWHYDHLLPDGRVERLTAQVQHRLDSLQDYLDAFSAAGLQVERFYGDYDSSAYQPDSENLIILARSTGF
jgi:SAM-dependent methyltransferase